MLAAGILLGLAAAPPTAVAERRAILATIEQFFDALEARSAEGVLATVVPHGSITAHAPNGSPGKARTRSWDEWARELPTRPEPLIENLHRPEIRIRGSLASVWSYYTFRRGQRFSHCGFDNFDLAKIDGRWRIVNLSFTVEPHECVRR